MFEPGDWQAILLSLKVSLAATAIAAIPSIFLGTWLARSRSPIRTAVEAVVIAPLVIPPVVTGIALLLLISWLGWSIAFTWWAAVLASGIVSAPLLVRTVRAATATIDPRLGQVAATLGASRLRVMLTVTLPMIRPAIIGGLTLTWARALGEFGATMVVAGNTPGVTRTIPLAMYTDFMSSGRSPWVLAGVSLLISVGAVAVAERLITQSSRMQAHARHTTK